MDRMIVFKEEGDRHFPDGWILYRNGDDSFSPHYIELYRSACHKRGMSIRLGFYEKCCEDAGKEMNALEKLLISERPDFVINRTRDWRLAEFLESQGIRVYNHSLIARLGNDKSEAYRYMQQKGIPVMPVRYSIDTPPPWYPAVVKSCDGHGGSEVFLIRDEAAWKEWMHGSMAGMQQRRDTRAARKYVVQQAASDLGKDVRVYIVGNRITAAVLRSSKTDFRSNYCLGGSVELYTLSEKERALVQRAAAGLSIGMAGMDFIFHHGQPVFNEIEDMAGARGLYSLTDYDIVDAYISYIWEELQHVGNTDKTDLQKMSAERSGDGRPEKYKKISGGNQTAGPCRRGSL